MDRLSLLILVLAGCLSVTTAQGTDLDGTCERTSGFPKSVCYSSACTDAIKAHIQHEFNAAFKYMYMGSYFAQDSISRPGLAKFLLEAAAEERGHAIQMLDYLNLRGIKIDSRDANMDYKFEPETVAELVNPASFNYEAALNEAVNMEIEVTKKIHLVVGACDHDFHGADVFTNPFLDEQHDGLRKLQGAVRAFTDLQNGAQETSQLKELAEYMFDLKLLSGELF